MSERTSAPKEGSKPTVTWSNLKSSSFSQQDAECSEVSSRCHSSARLYGQDSKLTPYYLHKELHLDMLDRSCI